MWLCFLCINWTMYGNPQRTPQGPNLFYVDDGGSRLKSHLFSVGSGSTFAYGVLDSEYHYDLSVKDALELGRRSIYHAAHRDAYSGGTINRMSVLLQECLT